MQLAIQNQGLSNSSGPIIRPRSAWDYWEDALQTTGKTDEDEENINEWIVLPAQEMDKVCKRCLKYILKT